MSRETKFAQAQTETGKYQFSLFSWHEHDWQSYPVNPYPAISYDHTHMQTGIYTNSIYAAVLNFQASLLTFTSIHTC